MRPEQCLSLRRPDLEGQRLRHAKPGPHNKGGLGKAGHDVEKI